LRQLNCLLAAPTCCGTCLWCLCMLVLLVLLLAVACASVRATATRAGRAGRAGDYVGCSSCLCLCSAAPGCFFSSCLGWAHADVLCAEQSWSLCSHACAACACAARTMPVLLQFVLETYKCSCSTLPGMCLHARAEHAHVRACATRSSCLCTPPPRPLSPPCTHVLLCHATATADH